MRHGFSGSGTRGAADRTTEGPPVAKGLDFAILGRLFSFLAPYRGPVVLALAALIVATAGELALPVLIQTTIDGPILGRYRLLTAEEAAGLAPGTLNRSGSPAGGPNVLVPDTVWASQSEPWKKSLEAARPEVKSAYWAAGPLSARPELAELQKRLGDRTRTVDDRLVLSAEDYHALSQEDKKAFRRQDFETISAVAALLFAILGVVMLASFAQIFILALMSQKVMKDLRLRLYGHFLSQSSQYLAENPVGKLVSGVTSDVAVINEFFNSLFTSMLKDLALMAGAVATLFALNPTLGLITLLSLPPVFVLVYFFRRQNRRANRQTRAQVARVNSFLSEYISGMGIVQLFGREERSVRDFTSENRTLLKANLSEMWVNALFRPFIDVLSALSLGVIIFFGAGLALRDAISLGVLIAFINLVGKFYSPVSGIAENFTLLQSAMAGAERVFGYLDEHRRVPDLGRRDLAELPMKAIEFREVDFSYVEGEPVLRKLSFELKGGETLAVVGYTGAGKTTITSLLTRMWDTGSGSIAIDGVDIRELTLASLRGGVQSVLQDVFLFSGTIYDNIDLGRGLTPERIEEVCRVVQAHDFIQKLPQGYQTQLNEGATNVSSGQRQLISFARVLAQNPRLLILDEATANVDTATEVLIQKAMEELLRNRTSIVIAHRLSTIRHAHQILVLHEGEIVEKGTHGELMELGGFYYNLYKLQYEKQEGGGFDPTKSG